jgi:hypothetical protein
MDRLSKIRGRISWVLVRLIYQHPCLTITGIDHTDLDSASAWMRGIRMPFHSSCNDYMASVDHTACQQWSISVQLEGSRTLRFNRRHSRHFANQPKFLSLPRIVVNVPTNS